MAKLPTQKRILKEDLKGAPDWVSPLIDTCNNFFETIYQALNQNITFSQNVACFVKEITYKTTSSYPTMDVVEFTSELKTKATGVWVMQAYEKSTYEPASGPVYVPWVEVNGSIRVYSITGLEADKTYIIRLLVA